MKLKKKEEYKTETIIKIGILIFCTLIILYFLVIFLSHKETTIDLPDITETLTESLPDITETLTESLPDITETLTESLPDITEDLNFSNKYDITSIAETISNTNLDSKHTTLDLLNQINNIFNNEF